MTPTSTCPNCGRANPSVNSFCAGCGANLSSQVKGNGWKVLFGTLALFVGIVWAAAIYTRTPSTSPVTPTQPQSLVSSNATPNSAPQSLTLTSAQQLAEAKRALADGYKPNKDPKKTSWGEVAAAKWHLKTIDTSAAEYQEAQELLKEVARREKQIELMAKQPAASPSPQDVSTAADVGRGGNTSSDPSSAASSTSVLSAPRQSSSAGQSIGTSSEDYYTNSDGVRVHRPTFSNSGPPAGATAQCGDGSYSFSLHRSGTCSHHGGVMKWL
jgi:Protein of unknown function (DUF3761)